MVLSRPSLNGVMVNKLHLITYRNIWDFKSKKTRKQVRFPRQFQLNWYKIVQVKKNIWLFFQGNTNFFYKKSIRYPVMQLTKNKQIKQMKITANSCICWGRKKAAHKLHKLRPKYGRKICQDVCWPTGCRSTALMVWNPSVISRFNIRDGFGSQAATNLPDNTNIWYCRNKKIKTKNITSFESFRRVHSTY